MGLSTVAKWFLHAKKHYSGPLLNLISDRTPSAATRFALVIRNDTLLNYQPLAEKFSES